MKDEMKEWCKAALVRAVKTFAQAMVAAIPATAATVGSVDWATALGTGALAAVLSILTSIAGVPEVDGGAAVHKLGEKSAE